jgi:hypothetical protein
MDINCLYVPLDRSQRGEAALRAATAVAARVDARVQPIDVESWSSVVAAASEPGALVCTSLLDHVGDLLPVASGPLLLVGPNLSRFWHLAAHPLVFAGAGASDASSVADCASAVAARLGGSVLLLDVLPPRALVTIGEFPHDDVTGLRRLVERLEDAGTHARWAIVDADEPGEALARQAATGHAGFLVLTSRSSLGHVVLTAVHDAPCPVWVFGSQARAALADGLVSGDQSR